MLNVTQAYKLFFSSTAAVANNPQMVTKVFTKGEVMPLDILNARTNISKKPALHNTHNLNELLETLIRKDKFRNSLLNLLATFIPIYDAKKNATPYLESKEYLLQFQQAMQHYNIVNAQECICMLSFFKVFFYAFNSRDGAIFFNTLTAQRGALKIDSNTAHFLHSALQAISVQVKQKKVSEFFTAQAVKKDVGNAGITLHCKPSKINLPKGPTAKAKRVDKIRQVAQDYTGPKKRNELKQIDFCDKKGFSTQREAGEILHSFKHISSRSHIPQRTYYCTLCNLWHLTSISVGKDKGNWR